MTDIINISSYKARKAKHSFNVGAIISARMTSKRFPGKSMALLCEKPVIQWCMERSKRIAKNVNVILAVPDVEESQPMLDLATAIGVDNFCGSELDVLDRVYNAAKFFNLDVIIRITGDCPFIDPRVCFEVCSLLIWRKLDYVSNVYPTRSHPRGMDCEAFTFDALEAAHMLATSEYDREHVTPWMQRIPEITKANIIQKMDMSHKNYCVDYPEDIPRIEKEIAEMKSKGKNLIVLPGLGGKL